MAEKGSRDFFSPSPKEFAGKMRFYVKSMRKPLANRAVENLDPS